MSRLREAVYQFLDQYDSGTGVVKPFFIEAIREAVIADAEDERRGVLSLQAMGDQLHAYQDSALAAQRKAIEVCERHEAEIIRLKRLAERIELGLPPTLTTAERAAFVESGVVANG